MKSAAQECEGKDAKIKQNSQKKTLQKAADEAFRDFQMTTDYANEYFNTLILKYFKKTLIVKAGVKRQRAADWRPLNVAQGPKGLNVPLIASMVTPVSFLPRAHLWEYFSLLWTWRAPYFHQPFSLFTAMFAQIINSFAQTSWCFLSISTSENSFVIMELSHMSSKASPDSEQ